MGCGVWDMGMGSGSGCWRVPSERSPFHRPKNLTFPTVDVYMLFVTDDPSCGTDVGNYLRSKFFPITHLHFS